MDDLTEAGQLRAEPNPAHRRSPLYGVTPEGAELLERLRSASESPRLGVLSATEVSAEELNQARETLRRLVVALDDQTGVRA